jgi:hypothetical protein
LEEVVTHLKTGKNVSFESGYNQCQIKKTYLESHEGFNIVAIGSSLSNQIGKEFFEKDSFFNASIRGSNLYDLLAAWQLIEENNLSPQEVILEVSSKTLRLGHSRNRKYLMPYTNKLLKEMDLSESIQPEETNVALKLKARALFSIQYGFKGLFKDIYRVSLKEDSLDKIVLLADGSEKARINPNNDKLQFQNKILPKLKIAIEKGEFNLEDETKLILMRFIKYLKSKGKRVSLYIPPVHPESYDQGYIEEVYENYNDFVTKLHNEFDIQILGSYNPSIYNLNKEDFSDYLHFKRKAMVNIFDKNLFYVPKVDTTLN